MPTTREELEPLILRELARREVEIAARPKPPKWKTWDAALDADDREFGPRYSPTWFGDAAATESRRVRVLRTIYRLHEVGLVVVVKSEGGRLERLRLTPEGRAAVAELNAPTDQPTA